MSSWREIDRDERYRVKFVVYRCVNCRRKAVTTGYGEPHACVCSRRSS